MTKVVKLRRQACFQQAWWPHRKRKSGRQQRTWRRRPSAPQRAAAGRSQPCQHLDLGLPASRMQDSERLVEAAPAGICQVALADWMGTQRHSLWSLRSSSCPPCNSPPTRPPEPSGCPGLSWSVTMMAWTPQARARPRASRRHFMAAAGVVLLSSAGSGGLRQQAWGLIQEACRPASPGWASATRFSESHLAFILRPRGWLPLREDNRRLLPSKAKQEVPSSGPRRFLVDPQKPGTGGCLDSGPGWLPVPGTLPGSALDKDRSGASTGDRCVLEGGLCLGHQLLQTM